jgi:uncharacterized membrane protein HdeD (DUF308 family)
MSNIISKVSNSVKNWWIFLIIGVLLIFGAVWMFKTPVESFVSLALLFSTLILISGVLSIIFALANRADIDNWGLYLAGGILDFVIGFILLKYPGLTLVLFSMFIGFWLLFRGFNTISVSLKLKKDGGENWTWILFFGALIVMFAFMSIVNPLIGASYLVYTLALSILLLGIANIFLGMQLKKVKGAVGEVRDNIKSKAENIKENLTDR